MASDKDLIADAVEQFHDALEAESTNRSEWLDDIKFAKLAEQWPSAIVNQRQLDQRPCLTINRIPQFLRQVINDARQNRPSINVKPVDSQGDPRTAEIFNGLIRNIEVVSGADVAYDTAFDGAVSGGFGYFRIDVDYASDDTFDLDILIKRISNPLTVLGDPRSTEADSCDWDRAFVSEKIPRDVFEKTYKGAKPVNWQDQFTGVGQEWLDDDDVRVAEWWTRESADKVIVKLSDGQIIPASNYKDNIGLFTALQLQVVGERTVKSKKVIQRLITAAEVLSTTEWKGYYIPIIPVYGDEINVEGKRKFLSLIRHAKDAQRMFNYWRTAATELVALAPRVPYIGPKGFAKSDPNWETVNIQSHPYLEFDGPVPPARQMLDGGVAAGALQEALNASDDLKSIMGIYDASLGARSNETSGRAIVARQRQGNISTYHFIDNLTRSIRHAGRVLVDLIPQIYTDARVVRILGEDGKAMPVQINQQIQGPDGSITKIFDLSAGKYDVVVKAGPAFSTRREESSSQMMDLIHQFPQIAPLVGDILARNLDWPEADTIAQRLQVMLPPQLQGAPPPQIQQQMQGMQQQIQQMGQALQKMQVDLTEANLESQKKDVLLAQKDLTVLQEKVNSGVKEVGAREQMLNMQQDAAMGAMGNHMQGLADMQNQINTMQQSIAAMADGMQQMAQHAATPKRKTGTATKLADGRWQLDAVEQPQQMIQ